MKTIKCPQCKMVNWTTVDFCKRCSFNLVEISASAAKLNADEGNFVAQTQTSDYQNFSQTPTIAENNSNQYAADGYQEQHNWNGQNANRQSGGNDYANYQNRQNFRGANVKTNNKMAIAAMILGICSFPFVNVFIGILLSIILASIFGVSGAFAGFGVALAILPTGLITGIVALRKSSKLPTKFGGKGLAITGIALSSFGLLVIPLVAAIAIPNLLGARRAANEGSAISTIRTLAQVENDYMSATSGKCGDIQSLIVGRLIDPSLAKNEKSGYRFVVANIPTGGCEIHATPLAANGASSTGERSFYASSEESWTIRAADKNGALADKNDPPLDTGFSVNLKTDLSSDKNEVSTRAKDENKVSVSKGKPLLDERTPLNETEQAALDNLRAINHAEEEFNFQHLRNDGGKISADISNLVRSNLLKPELSDGVDGGYRFETVLGSDGSEINATPIENASENRSFFLGTDNVLRGEFKNGAIANKMDRGLKF